MSKAIWKFPLADDCVSDIAMPIGARVLDVQVQHGTPCIWALVAPGNPKEVVRFRYFGTGHQMPDDPGFFVGTFQVENGDYVFHLFREPYTTTPTGA